jgi:hypothetical protein
MLEEERYVRKRRRVRRYSKRGKGREKKCEVRENMEIEGQ